MESKIFENYGFTKENESYVIRLLSTNDNPCNPFNSSEDTDFSFIEVKVNLINNQYVATIRKFKGIDKEYTSTDYLHSKSAERLLNGIKDVYDIYFN